MRRVKFQLISYLKVKALPPKLSTSSKTHKQTHPCSLILTSSNSKPFLLLYCVHKFSSPYLSSTLLPEGTFGYFQTNGGNKGFCCFVLFLRVGGKLSRLFMEQVCYWFISNHHLDICLGLLKFSHAHINLSSQ